MKTTLQLEDEDFRIDSTGWKEIDGEKVNPQGDVWEKDGNQYFTFDAALRETKKAGKKIPTKEQWEKIYDDLRVDGINSILNKNGYRLWDNVQYYTQNTDGYYWSSSPNLKFAYILFFTSSWVVTANYDYRTIGFSVRCLNNQSDYSENEFSEIIESLKIKRSLYETKAQDIQKAIDVISNL